jgi:hypothetical protein
VTNPSKRKGDAFERLVAGYLAEAVPCERIPAGATGGLDRGDLWTPTAALQCKNVARLSLGAWWDATVEQQSVAGKGWGWLVVKRRGVADPARQFAVCDVAQLRAALEVLP